jgi:hypothetical protein
VAVRKKESTADNTTTLSSKYGISLFEHLPRVKAVSLGQLGETDPMHRVRILTFAKEYVSRALDNFGTASIYILFRITGKSQRYIRQQTGLSKIITGT